MKIPKGRVVDATIIRATTLGENKDEPRVPEMHETTESRQWYFGISSSGFSY